MHFNRQQISRWDEAARKETLTGREKQREVKINEQQVINAKPNLSQQKKNRKEKVPKSDINKTVTMNRLPEMLKLQKYQTINAT